jgi:hypothetical protein
MEVNKEENNKKELSEKYIEQGSGGCKTESLIDCGIAQHNEDG